MKFAIVFSSKTGNTKMLADGIWGSMPIDGCVYYGNPEVINMEVGIEADLFFVGFWTEKSTCNKAQEEFLKQLREKTVFLFGTAGRGASKAHFDEILKNVKANLDESVQVVGQFMCQGKMPTSVRHKYESLAKILPEKVKPEIENFDQALFHPDEEDIKNLRREMRAALAKMA